MISIQPLIDFLEADADNIYHLDPHHVEYLRKVLNSPPRKLDFKQAITDVLCKHKGMDGNPIGEGGCPRIDWYTLRNELIAAVTASIKADIESKDYLLSVSDTVAQQLQNQIVTLTLKKEDLEAKLAAARKELEDYYTFHRDILATRERFGEK